MEKISSSYGVKEKGVLRLPPGFRFHPTDEELVVQYLKRKVLSWPLPASIIPHFDVCKSDPWDLPGNMEQERYFFSSSEVKGKGKRSNRATASGYWKASGVDKQIVSSRGQLLGFKKTLVFYRGKPLHASRTDWIMHEYRLPNLSSNASQENWVLCRIFLKKRGSKNGEELKSASYRETKSKKQQLLYFDFMGRDLNMTPPASPSSSVSGITQLSTTDESEQDNEQTSTSSSCNSCFSTCP